MRGLSALSSALKAIKREPLGVLACLATGALTFMSFPNAWSPELNLWWMMWFSHVPLLWWLLQPAPQEPQDRDAPLRGARWAFWWAFLCGFIINTGGYYWIAELAQTFGHLPTPVSYVILGLHSALLGLIWGLWGVAVRLLHTRVGLTWVAPLAMVAFEHFMPRIFPAYMGDCQASFSTVMQVSDLFGVSAVTFLLYRVNAELTQWLMAWWMAWRPLSLAPSVIPERPARLRSLWLTLGLLVASLTYGHFRIEQVEAMMAEAPKLKVGVVEADVGIFESETLDKRRDHLLILQRLSQELVARGAELIIWSESSYRMSAFPAELKRVHVSERPLVRSWRDDLEANTPRVDRVTPLRGFKAPLLMGGGAVERPQEGGDNTSARYYNTAWLISEEGELLGRYDKMVRLVFGEYIPFGDVFPIFYEWLPSASHLTKGEGVKSLTLPRPSGDVRLGVLICYEGILPGFARDVVATNPDVLINLTNDDWFGVSAERYLHFILAQPRAIESRRAFIRSTLTGVSAVIDPVGRVVEWTKPEGEETILREVPLMRPWTLYQVIGDAFAWGALLWLLFVGRERLPLLSRLTSRLSSSSPSSSAQAEPTPNTKEPS